MSHLPFIAGLARRPFVWLAVIVLALVFAQPASATTYTFVPQVPSGTDDTHVLGISGSLVAGYYTSSADGLQHGFDYSFDTHAYTTLDPDGSEGTTIDCVSGNYIGGYYSGGPNNIGFLYNTNNSSFTTVNVPNSDGTTVTGVSASDAVGSYYGNGVNQGFVYDINNKTYTTINPSGSSATNVIAISGTNVTGYYFDGNNNVGFVYNVSTAKYVTFDLAPNGFDTIVTGISGNYVVGSYSTGSFTTGFIYNLTTKTATLYDPSNGRATYLNAIAGTNVVGNYFDGSEYIAFIYNFSTTTSTELDPDPSGTFPSPHGVSGSSVAGDYSGSDGNSHGFLGFIANATITLNGSSSVNYDGTAKTLTAVTSPVGLTVTKTYQPVDGSGAPLGPPSATAPINVGTYAIVATVDDGAHLAMTTATLVITAAPVTVTVENLPGSLGPMYDGTPKSLTATTNPPGVAYSIDYTNFGVDTNGPPTNVGDYVGTASITNPNYVLANPTTASGELDINFATQTINLSSLGTLTVNDVFTLPETSSAGLPITYFFLDSNNDQVTSTDVATLTNGPDNATDNILTILKKGPITLYATAPPDANHLAASPPGQSIGVNLAIATIMLADLSVSFNGSAQTATATTNPPHLFTDGDVAFTYQDSSGHPVTPSPVMIGKYTVSATITDPDDMYQGSTTGTMVIGQDFATWQKFYFTSTDPTVIGATATPKHDGISNATKYLCDVNPTQVINATDRAALPTTGIDSTTTPNTEYLTLTYRQASLATGATVQLQASSDAKTWTTLTPADSPADLIDQQVGLDATTGDPIIEIGAKMTGTNTRFIRLEITEP